MKKQQIAAAACLVAGAIGFAAVYSTQKPGKDEIPTEISQTSSIVEPTEKKTPQKTTEKVDSETKMGQEESAAGQQENQQPTEKQLHFVPENVTNWPVKGDVLLPFSMDKTVYFPTLDQYQYNRGMVIRANEGDAVCSVTEGRIIDIYDSAETGCTVVQDLGDGYTATYGQLANLTCSEGDVLEAGETLGTVGKVTRYYTVEGTNVYFAMEQDGKVEFNEYNESVKNWTNGILDNYRKDAELTIRYCHELIDYGEKTADSKLLGFGYYHLAMILYCLNDYDNIFDIVVRAIDHLEKAQR